MRLVLREDAELADAGVDQVGQDEVHETVRAAEGHGGFGAVGGERHQPFALAAGEDDAQDLRRPAAQRRGAWRRSGTGHPRSLFGSGGFAAVPVRSCTPMPARTPCVRRPSSALTGPWSPVTWTTSPRA